MADKTQTQIKQSYKTAIEPQQSEEEEEEEEEEEWEDWVDDDDGEEDNDSDSNLLCLFCDSKYRSSVELFAHCRAIHNFDFQEMTKALSLDFYSSFKLINYIRSQVAANKCWSCGLAFQSNQDLQDHLHETRNIDDIKLLWNDDRFLKPFIQDDSLLYSFNDDDEGEDDGIASINKEELLRDLVNIEGICVEDYSVAQTPASSSNTTCENVSKEVASTFNSLVNMESSSSTALVNDMNSTECVGASDKKITDQDSKVSLLNLAAGKIKKVNEDYFGGYSSYGIHREMLSDKVRMDAYSQAILKNPSLMSSGVVMDVGCGTGILSLFAAQAGASRVIAVEASEKMAAVATQIAKENSLLRRNTQIEGNNSCTGVIEVAQGMVEELDKSIQIQPHSVDVLLSEWMGYCLLYESMLSSVLYARDKWLKPGGAILPDTATIYAAGFGRGVTSLSFWEDVCGFNMSCIAKELVKDAAQIPIVDVVNECDLVTDAVVLQTFDLATMKADEVDFTASVELEPKVGSLLSSSTVAASETTWCYGVVLWFDAGFTTRFCKETPVVLSTSPYTPSTHWSQTLFTFLEPIAIQRGELSSDRSAAVGTNECPASRLLLRMSIARAVQHRCIDISLETAGISADGRKRSWPVQIFNLS